MSERSEDRRPRPPGEKSEASRARVGVLWRGRVGAKRPPPRPDSLQPVAETGRIRARERRSGMAFVIAAWMLVASAALTAQQSPPGVCFSFDANLPPPPTNALPLVAGGHLYFGFTSPQTTSIEQLDVYMVCLTRLPGDVGRLPSVCERARPPSRRRDSDATRLHVDLGSVHPVDAGLNYRGRGICPEVHDWRRRVHSRRRRLGARDVARLFARLSGRTLPRCHRHARRMVRSAVSPLA